MKRILTTASSIGLALSCMTAGSVGASSTRHAHQHHIKAIQVRHAGRCSRLLLILHSGLRLANGKLDKDFQIPRDTPRYPVVVSLPLEPGSVRTHVPEYMQSGFSAGLRYLKSADAGFTVSVPMRKVKRWYVKSLRDCGFAAAGSGSSSTTNTPTVYEIDAISNADANNYLTVSMAAKGSGQTRVLIEAVAAADPRRPEASYLPYSAKTMKIDYRGGYGSTPVTLTVTDHSLIQFVSEAFNQDNKVQGEVIDPCPIGVPTANVTFTTQSGKRVEGSFGEPCLNYNVTKWINGKKKTWWFAGQNDIQSTIELVIRAAKA